MSLTIETTNNYKLGDTYRGLLSRFPLWPIRNEKQYDRATDVAQDLMGRTDLDVDESAYLDTLILLISAYEAQSHNLDKEASHLKPFKALRFLMEENGIKQTEIARLLKVGASAVSMIVSGERQITASHARALGKRFSVDPGLFI